MLRSAPIRCLFWVLLANLFYDDPTLYWYKRVMYSVFIYAAVFEVIFYIYTRRRAEATPRWYRRLSFLLVLFSIGLCVMDITGPRFKPITLFNNPYALLSITPVAFFLMGYDVRDLRPLRNLLLFTAAVFIVMFIRPLPGKVSYYQAFIACGAVVPLLLVSAFGGRGGRWAMWFAIFLFPVAMLFSKVSDYRIVLLRVLMFTSLATSLWMVRRSAAFLKPVILIAAAAMTFMILYNLEGMLNAISDFFGGGNFDFDDTRSFLYQELSGDLHGWEWVRGKGFLGTYHSEYFMNLYMAGDPSADFFERFSVEVGSLELILKGGVIFYILYLAPLFLVSMKALFSRKAGSLPYFFGIYIFTELLLMFFENIPYFSFHFSLLFFLAGYAYREMGTVTARNPMIKSHTKGPRPAEMQLAG